MQLPTYFTISPENQTGEVYGTEFVFTANLPYQYTKFVWDFGDRSSLSYDNQTPSHVYNYPGIYTVQLSSWTDAGEQFVDSATIDVNYVYRDSVLFTQIPETYGIPGTQSVVPFTVSLTSAKIDQELSLVLQSFGSKSVPHNTVSEKWRFITPTWKFTETDGTILEGPLILPKVPIYNNEGKIIAVRAEKSFYYIDDLSTGLNPDVDCPLMLVATLSTERFYYPPESLIYPYAGYSNSEVARAVISWQINDVIPTNLVVTENFINPINPIKWTNIPIPVMITLESNSTFQTNYTPDPETKPYRTKTLSYPRTNEIGYGNPVTLTLSSDTNPNLVEGVDYRVDEAPLHFKATDEYGNVASGYIFTTITPLNSFDGNLVITAAATVVSQPEGDQAFSFPIGFPIQPHVYVSHPAKNTINRIEIPNAPANCTAISKYRNLGILVEGSLSFVSTQTDASGDTANLAISGSNVYALTFNPNANRLYTADFDLNTVNCYFAGTTLLTSINLENIFNKTSLGPSHISVDRDNNVWVSLYDSRCVVKFDFNLNYLLSAIPFFSNYHLIVEPQETEEEFLLNEDDSFLNLQLKIDEDNFDLHPPIVETDRENNVWVCYPGPGSFLYKFDSDGNTLLRAGQLPLNSSPVSLSIDANNNVWVACKSIGSLMCFSSEGNLISTVGGLSVPSYIAHDRSGNICILHGYDIFSIYNTYTSDLSSWRIDMVGGEKGEGLITSVSNTEFLDEQTMISKEIDEIWGGLCTDVYNRVWIIDSNNNTVMSFKPDDINHFKITKITPAGNYKKYFLSDDSTSPSVTAVEVDVIRSAQAGGDWSGNRWFQKYGSGRGSIPVVGISAPFTVTDLDNSYMLSKVNSTFDFGKHVKSLAFSEILQQNTELFDFLSVVAGDGDPSKENISSVVYEKIANFVSNRGDIETSEIDALVSMAQQTEMEYKEFGKNFPVTVNNLINLFSIHKHNLRGIPNTETDIEINTGDRLTESSTMTANRFYLARNKRDSTPLIVWANPVKEKLFYPISEFQSDALISPVLDNYYLFEYNTNNINKNQPYVGNLIDWQNPVLSTGEIDLNAISDITTLAYTMSSMEDWYGDGGIVETMFNNLLTKQLFPQ